VESEETIIARQRLGKDVPAVTNTQATKEEMLDMVFSMPSLSYQIFSMQRKYVNINSEDQSTAAPASSNRL
jgi:hypothetical protein